MHPLNVHKKSRDGACAGRGVPGDLSQIEARREEGGRPSEVGLEGNAPGEAKALASATVGVSSREKKEDEAAAGGRREAETRSLHVFTVQDAAPAEAHAPRGTRPPQRRRMLQAWGSF